MLGLGLVTLAATAAASTVPTGVSTPAASGWEPRDYLALISAVTTIIALLVSYFVSSRTLQASLSNTEASIWQKANEAEMKSIQDQLDGFFGPFMQLSKMNLLLYRDLRDRQPDSGTFLLIEKLFDREWLNGLPQGQRAIVGELAANARVLREFIAERARMVNLKVQPYLSRVSAHYRMIELAYEGKLGDDAALFVQRYVFPVQIDEILNLEVARLEARLNLLRANPGKTPPPSTDLAIPERLNLREWVNPPREPRPELNVPVA